VVGVHERRRGDVRAGGQRTQLTDLVFVKRAVDHGELVVLILAHLPVAPAQRRYASTHSTPSGSGSEDAITEGLVAPGLRILEREAERLGALAVRGDVTVASDLQKLVERTLEAFGGIDILVNNGGGPPRGTALDMAPETIEAAVELLLVSAVRLTGLCLPHLERSGQGRVITITSSSVREPIDNLALSNTIRPGVIGWAKTLAREVGARGITVNSIAPGRIDTDRLKEVYPDGPSEQQLEPIPLRRLGRPQEIGDIVCFLASGRAGYVTGTVVPVDGGLTRGLL